MDAIINASSIIETVRWMMELGIDVIKNYEEFYERKLKIDHLLA